MLTGHKLVDFIKTKQFKGRSVLTKPGDRMKWWSSALQLCKPHSFCKDLRRLEPASPLCALAAMVTLAYSEITLLRLQLSVTAKRRPNMLRLQDPHIPQLSS